MWATSRRLTLAFLFVAGPAATAEPPPIEVAIHPLPLAAPLDARGAELSGLAWCGDDLVLLPQFPRDALFAIEKAAIRAALASGDDTLLTARLIPFEAAALREQISDFEGFEAVAFHKGHAYFAIESESRGRMSAWLVRGHVEDGCATIQLEMETAVEVPLPVQIFNMAIEAMTIAKDQVLVFFEANGGKLVTEAQIQAFDLDLKPVGLHSMPAVEYRLTDATGVDATGTFWVSNYLWPGERRLLQPTADAFAERFGVGASHQGSATVERLLPLSITESGIGAADRPPIYLALDPEAGRNWEGIVRLDDAGFLLVTDSHPTTMLAFVPDPAS